MIPKDWVRETAVELAGYFTFGSGRDSYVTDEQRNEVAKSYATIILKHVPFQPDVAYMPVPRCDGCRHWRQFELEDAGECLDTESPVGMACGQGLLETKADFGCVRWEAK